MVFEFDLKEWEGKASVAGRKSGDLTFPLVYCPEFHYPEFNSAVADMKNSVAVSFISSTQCLVTNTPKICIYKDSFNISIMI